MDHSFFIMFFQHNPYLMMLSYIIAAISAYASIDLARRVIFSSGTDKLIWLLSGGATLGIGIWSMHFIAMLAHDFTIPVYYNTSLVVLSVVVSAIACILGYFLISRNIGNRMNYWSAGILMGLGIVSMHYIGTEAIQPLVISYNIPLVLVSAFIAISASLAALWLGFLYAKNEMSWRVKVSASLIMAVAIAGMHYTGMAASQFTEITGNKRIFESGIDANVLAWVVAVVTLLIFTLFFFSIIFDRFFRKQAIVQNTILDAAAEGIILTDRTNRILHANPAFYLLMNQAGIQQKFYKLHDYHLLLTEDVESGDEFHLEMKDSTLEAKRHSVKIESMNNSLWMIRDITESIHSKRRIEHLAYHDQLTNLPNRYQLDAILQDWLQDGNEIGCILFNADRLKFINDTLGLPAGDATLQYISKKLREIANDGNFLARTGGDEFVMLVTGEQVKNLQSIAAQCIEVTRCPFIFEEVSIETTLSAGYCKFPREADSAHELLQYADLAMSESKRSGKNQATAFNVAIKDQHKRFLQLEDALSTALEQNQFHLLYQPKVSLDSNRIVGAEALLRWVHPILGFVSPVDFIPIAEGKGMIHAIGEWVLREACRQWKEWAEEMQEPPIIAVNISPLQLTRDDFVEHLMRIIDETRMDPRYLELEITESASLAYETQSILTEIAEAGIQISLDDFGTGYSSFSQLKELPIHVLKIDKSFLDDLLGNAGQEAIVRSIIQLGHNLNLRVVMEGVEEKEEVVWLRKAHCDFVQGYYFYRPMKPDLLLETLKEEFAQNQ
ncbi:MULTISPECIES: EAL domain-containing protein [unclassified Sporosarcina]|uniref:EAL domain-containing protein n=1 Tax=unclassified Sporosarcina TaxID=2647733 RepID=UPI0020424611|nr:MULTISPECIES: EAL domain-containing protein [unclassified Sporosarcina]GKV64721.1 bifunctional diguanylate cyclase/phosphodiesterase [Sporosarcina sp. NCCP-2331]GLB54831.1 bifunctional diguanylate cyclase/phosphodiesterase [Sporosarcina sp. NCCP-2378]